MHVTSILEHCAITDNIFVHWNMFDELCLRLCCIACFDFEWRMSTNGQTEPVLFQHQVRKVVILVV